MRKKHFGSTFASVVISLKDAVFLQEQPGASCVLSRMSDLSLPLSQPQSSLLLLQFSPFP